MPRTAIQNFQLANRVYANCRVSFFTVAAGVATATLATLYADTTGSTQLENPVRLDSNGKFADAPYIDAPVIGQVTGLSIATHETGVISPAPTFRVDSSTGKLQYSFDAGVSWNDSGQYIFKFRSAWVTATAYNVTDVVTNGGSIYICQVAHTSGVFATDLAASKWLLLSLGATASSITNVPAGNIAATDVQAALNELDTEKAKLAGLSTQVFSVAAAATADEAPRADQIQKGNISFAVGGGTANAITATYTPTVAALTDGMVLGVRATAANTSTTPTFAPDGITAHTITKRGGSALMVGDIPGNLAECLFRYNLANTRWELLNPTIQKQPTRTVLTTSSGTYTTPTGASRINVRLIGAGGGGSGNDAGAGSNGANTTFSTLTASGGAAGNSTAPGTGGAAAGGDINIPGATGGGPGLSAVAATFMAGGVGGASALGGAGASGAGNSNGGTARTNSGSGGGGGGAPSAGNGGAGGGAGGYVEKLLTSPSATYSYVVGGAGAGSVGSASTGGNGAVGIIIIDEWYD